VHGVARRDRGSDEHPLHTVQLAQLALERGDAPGALRHGQRIVGHSLDLAHNEGKHSVRKQRGEQRQRITRVLGNIPGRVRLPNQITTARGDIEVERLAAPWALAMLQERTARQNAQSYGDCTQRGWNLTRVLARHRDSRTRADCTRPQHRPPDRSARGDP